MSLYGSYIAEREGYNIVEDDGGFATYKIDGEWCYIRDIYVKPELRKSGLASYLADMITVKAKELGCSKLLGSVSLGAFEPTASTKVLLAYGFELSHMDGNLIYFRKEI